MTRRTTKGTKQLAAELNASVVDEFKGFCKARGESLRYHMELALRRHMANPPPRQEPAPLPPAPPLPPVTSQSGPYGRPGDGAVDGTEEVDAWAKAFNKAAEPKAKKPAPKKKRGGK